MNEAIFPKPDLVIYIDIDLEEALKRKKELPIEFLKQVKENYEKVLWKYKVLILSGKTNPAINIQRIKDFIF